MLKPYLETAFKGKQDKKFKDVAGPELRKGHLAKDQCKRDFFPLGKVTGICWDGNQSLSFKDNINGKLKEARKDWSVDESQLRLVLPSQTANNKELILVVWSILQYGSFYILPLYIAVLLIFGGRDLIDESLTVLVIWIGTLIISKSLFLILKRFDLLPDFPHVIFNRSNGMVEIPGLKSTEYTSLPFEQFNAHHRTVHTQNGRALYGFTLLHYKQDLMYQRAQYYSITSALVHWELIKNFMDTTQPLADIPQFEMFREQDPETNKYDLNSGRPKKFWYRVNKSTMKEIKRQAAKVSDQFPMKEGSNSLAEANKHGYSIPEIINYPWRHINDLSHEPLKNCQSSFIKRFFITPLLLPI